MIYKFIRDGKEEKVKLERWVWGVVYQDGSELHQFDTDGTFHQFKEINLATVRIFTMYKPDDEVIISKRIDIAVKENMQIFHFYRNLKLAIGTQEERFVHIYVFGWTNKDTGEKNYHYILPDDRILVGSGDLALTNFGI